MKKIVSGLLLATATLFASGIKIDDAYVRATPPNLPNSAAFMKIENDTKNDVALLWAKSDAANVVELHTHDMKDGVMKMYQVPQIDIKADSETTLQPGGYHIMLIGLKQKPLKEGEKVTLTLGFSNGEEQTITVPVKSVMSGMMNHNGMDHKNMSHENMK